MNPAIFTHRGEFARQWQAQRYCGRTGNPLEVTERPSAVSRIVLEAVVLVGFFGLVLTILGKLI